MQLPWVINKKVRVEAEVVAEGAGDEGAKRRRGETARGGSWKFVVRSS